MLKLAVTPAHGYPLLLPYALASGSWDMLALLADVAAELSGADLWRHVLDESAILTCDLAALPPGEGAKRALQKSPKLNPKPKTLCMRKVRVPKEPCKRAP